MVINLKDGMAKFMSELFTNPLDKARKAVAAVFQVLKTGGKQGQIATCIGMSDAAMSRFTNEQLEQAIVILYHAGFKVVSQEMHCYPAKDVEAWYATYKRVMDHAATALEFGEVE